MFVVVVGWGFCVRRDRSPSLVSEGKWRARYVVTYLPLAHGCVIEVLIIVLVSLSSGSRGWSVCFCDSLLANTRGVQSSTPSPQTRVECVEIDDFSCRVCVHSIIFQDGNHDLCC